MGYNQLVDPVESSCIRLDIIQACVNMMNSIDMDLNLEEKKTVNVENGEKVNWLDLPDHVVGLVTDKLPDIKDYIRFGAVCHSWQSIYTENRNHAQCLATRQIPFLMLSIEEQGNPSNGQTRSLYSVSDNRVLPNVHLPVPHNVICRGSTQGWLVTLNENLSDVRLLNPFLSSDNKIELPPLTSFPHDENEIYNELFLTKAVLSANPASNPTFVVMAIYGQYCRLGFFKTGDEAWTPLNFRYDLIEDIIYYQNQFYVLRRRGEVFVFDVNDLHPDRAKAELEPPPGDYVGGSKKYLVDSSGDLLLIRRLNMIADYSYYTLSFEVFKLDASKQKWGEVKSIGDQALFLGDNYSISVTSSNFPGCKPNSIYFTDDNIEGYHAEGDGPHDMGIYNLEDRSIAPHYLLKSKTIYPPPIWIEPTLRSRSS